MAYNRFATPSRRRLEAFVQDAAASVQPGQRVLDAGAGDAVYGRHFGHVQYESADFCQVDKPYAKVTYTCDLAAIPVEDERFDLVLLTQVLEHLPEPARVLAELHRVLKPGGKLWFSAPLFYPEHEQPYDFYRYTQFGLRHRIEAAGFKLERIDWLEGYLATAGFQLRVAARALPRRPSRYGGGFRGWGFAAAAIGLRVPLTLAAGVLERAEFRCKVTDRGMCKNYAGVAVKPVAPVDR